MARDILCQFDTHKPLLDAKVKFDLLFAMGDKDEDGHVVTDAITHGGEKALGLTQILNLKDRAKGNGDCEILLDFDWWDDASEPQQRALLDHELHHVALKKKLDGPIEYDDLNRPKLKTRKHDVTVGWFKIVAARHGANSMEQIQAKKLMLDGSQYFWPDLFGSREAAEIRMGSSHLSDVRGVEDGTGPHEGSVTISTEGHEPVTCTLEQFSKAAKSMTRKSARAAA